MDGGKYGKLDGVWLIIGFGNSWADITFEVWRTGPCEVLGFWRSPVLVALHVTCDDGTCLPVVFTIIEPTDEVSDPRRRFIVANKRACRALKFLCIDSAFRSRRVLRLGGCTGKLTVSPGWFESREWLANESIDACSCCDASDQLPIETKLPPICSSLPLIMPGKCFNSSGLPDTLPNNLCTCNGYVCSKCESLNVSLKTAPRRDNKFGSWLMKLVESRSGVALPKSIRTGSSCSDCNDGVYSRPTGCSRFLYDRAISSFLSATVGCMRSCESSNNRSKSHRRHVCSVARFKVHPELNSPLPNTMTAIQ